MLRQKLTPTVVFPSTTTVASTTQVTSVVAVTSAPAAVSTVVIVPTPYATTCPTTGVYTIPATTITLTSDTTVCGATSTPLTSGSHTIGGVTTIVETSTVVTCPYATTTSTPGGTITSTILMTTYTCPEAGTYTIAPLTTSCSESTIFVYPTPTSYPSGTYTQPELTTTVTETDYTVWCPFATVGAASSTIAPVVAASTTAALPAETSAVSSGSSTGVGSSGGDQWAITYTPYDSTGACKSALAVAADIAQITLAGFEAVRLYSTDCSALDNIGAACEISGLRMILGVFIEASGTAAAQPQVDAIVAWGQWDLVELIVVGNEAISSGFISASELAPFVTASKGAFSAAGYTGPCTTTEPLDIWQENASALCGSVDVVGCNIHPFFNADVEATDAGTFVASQLQIVDGLCSGKTGVNLETGWPSFGTCNGVACPGVSNQQVAVAAIKASVGGRSVMFSFTDDEWKAPGDFDCEQSWGLIQLF